MRNKNRSVRLCQLLPLLSVFILIWPQTVRSQEPAIGFSAVKQPLSLQADAPALVMDYIAADLMPADKPASDFPDFLQTDALPRIVFISVSNGRNAYRIAMGRGFGLKKAVDHALLEVRKAVPPGFETVWVKLDIVETARSTGPVLLREVPTLKRDPDEGLAFGDISRIAVLPAHFTVFGMLDRRGLLATERLKAYIRSAFPRGAEWVTNAGTGRVHVFPFKVSSFFSDGRETVELYRGHRFFDNPGTADLLQAAESGGAYLTRVLNPQGRFLYSYHPGTGEQPNQYNILRHAGTLYSMLELYEVNKDAELLAAAKRALRYLLAQIKPCRVSGKEYLCVVERGEVKLGGNGLALVALAKYASLTGDRVHMSTAQMLGRWILATQDSRGEFMIHKQGVPSGKISSFKSGYYPGEALLGLLRMYALDRNPLWLESAARGAQWLINVRDRDVTDKTLKHDHWLLYALNDLYRFKQDKLYLDHALRIARVMVASQHRKPSVRDWEGGYYAPPRSAPTATRTEGLIAAYRLTRDLGDGVQQGDMLEAIRLGIEFQLQTQVRPENAVYLKNPRLAMGGFYASLVNMWIRNDYVQHNISAILGYLDILEKNRARIENK